MQKWLPGSIIVMAFLGDEMGVVLPTTKPNSLIRLFNHENLEK